MKIGKIGTLCVALLALVVGACASGDHSDVRQYQVSSPYKVGGVDAKKCGVVTLEDGSRQRVCGEAWKSAIKTVTPEFGIDNNVPATVAVDRDELIVQRDENGLPLIVHQQTYGAVETNGPANAALATGFAGKVVESAANIATAGLAGYFLSKFADDDSGGGAFSYSYSGASAESEANNIAKHKKH